MTKGKVIFFSVLVFVLGLASFSFTPTKLGTVQDYRIMAYLKYWGVIKPPIQNPVLLKSNLASRDPRVQADAAQTIGLLKPNPISIEGLRQFIDRRDVPIENKDLAIWALGELRAQNALKQLKGRLNDARYDQENLERAIEKIERNEPKPFMPE